MPRGLIALALLLALGARHAGADDSATAACAVPEGAALSRPDPSGAPTPVQVGLHVLGIDSIDEVTQSFVADVGVILAWNDPRLASGHSCRLPVGAVWGPGLVPSNGSRVETGLPDVVEVTPEGRVHLAQRYTGTFAASMDLRSFPFDEQALPIIFVSPSYGPRHTHG